MPGIGGAPRREEVDDGESGAGRPVGVREPDGRGTAGVAILISTMVTQARDAGRCAIVSLSDEGG